MTQNAQSDTKTLLINTMLTYPLARYRFEFTVLTPIRLPEYAGSMLRGAFGHALRRTACMTREKDCKLCPFYRTCPYPAIFETPPPEQHVLQKFTQIPNPYIIEPPAWGERLYQTGDTLAFNMVLIGQRTLDQLALITYAWLRAFAHEVGHGTARLHAVTHLAQDGEHAIYDLNQARLLPHTAQIQLPPQERDAVCLHFTTPLRLQSNGVPLPLSQLTALDLLRALLRRTHLLLTLQMGGKGDFDYLRLLQLAKDVRDSRELTWSDWTRYSSRQHQTMQLGGVVGNWQLHTVPPELHDWLQLGQWLHIGKNATFGLGRYTLTNSISLLADGSSGSLRDTLA